jgi:hypothetical protein
VDGGSESEEDRQYLREYYQSISEPKGYITLSDADHYANVANFGALVIFDELAVDELVDSLDSWLSEE